MCCKEAQATAANFAARPQCFNAAEREKLDPVTRDHLQILSPRNTHMQATDVARRQVKACHQLNGRASKRTPALSLKHISLRQSIHICRKITTLRRCRVFVAVYFFFSARFSLRHWLASRRTDVTMDDMKRISIKEKQSLQTTPLNKLSLFFQLWAL